jgi:hypothetical protein
VKWALLQQESRHGGVFAAVPARSQWSLVTLSVRGCAAAPAPAMPDSPRNDEEQAALMASEKIDEQLEEEQEATAKQSSQKPSSMTETEWVKNARRRSLEKTHAALLETQQLQRPATTWCARLRLIPQSFWTMVLPVMITKGLLDTAPTLAMLFFLKVCTAGFSVSHVLSQRGPLTLSVGPG